MASPLVRALLTDPARTHPYPPIGSIAARKVAVSAMVAAGYAPLGRQRVWVREQV